MSIAILAIVFLFAALWLQQHLEVSVTHDVSIGRDDNPLMIAIVAGASEEVVANIIAQDPSTLRGVDVLGLSALHCAADKRRSDLIRLFVHKGLNVDTPLATNTPNKGDPPICFAIQRGDLDTVKVFVELGAKLNYVDLRGRSLRRIAEDCGAAKVVEYLTELEKAK